MSSSVTAPKHRLGVRLSILFPDALLRVAQRESTQSFTRKLIGPVLQVGLVSNVRVARAVPVTQPPGGAPIE